MTMAMATTSTIDALEQFVADVEVLRGVHADQRALADAVAERLARLLTNPTWLCTAHCQPGDDCYRQHLLYVAPDGGFSVVALVWKPGQQTPIHDHVAWCVVGVYQGEESQTCYRLYQDARERFLVAVAHERATAGQTVILVPPDEDIHKVCCVADTTTISIHVYGANIAQLGTSINHRFDDLAIRTDTSGAQPVSWRDLYQ